jgi:hypothetical protein
MDMGVKNLTDAQIKDFADNPEGFLKNKDNLNNLLGFDSEAKRKIADVLKYEHGYSDADIKKALDEAAMVRLKEVDVYL